MSEGRWAANLAKLSHAELVAIAAKGCVGDSATALFASACLGAVLPAWCVNDVLLSPDIIQHLFMPLPIAANLPAVCSAWRNGWPQQLRTRRALRPVPCAQPADVAGLVFTMEAGGSRLLLENANSEPNIVLFDSNMDRIGSFDRYARVLHVSSDGSTACLRCYPDEENNELHIVSLPGFVTIKRVQVPNWYLHGGTVSAGSLYCSGSFEDDDGKIKYGVVVFDYATLERQHSWTVGFVTGALAVHNDEVYVGRSRYAGATTTPAISVFTKYGVPLRTIEIGTGEVRGLLFHDERLYATDYAQRVYVMTGSGSAAEPGTVPAMKPRL